MTRILQRSIVLAFVLSCACARPVPAPDHRGRSKSSFEGALTQLRRELTARYPSSRARIDRGIRQVGLFWTAADGDVGVLRRFVLEHYLDNPARRRAAFLRLQALFEQLFGHMVELRRELRFHSEVDTGPMLPLDKLTAAVEPAAHLTEELFSTKVAFVVLLNFPLTTLEQRLTRGTAWKRRQWAEARLAQRFAQRVPGHVEAKIAAVEARAKQYIADYNIYMHHVLDKSGQRRFRKGLRLISHWNLRDELKAAYSKTTRNGLAKQQMIAKVMERIIDQTIPRAVINNAAMDWNPFSNVVRAAPKETIERGAGRLDVPISGDREPDTRYQHWLACYRAARMADPHVPTAPTLMARRFQLHREIPQDRFESMIREVLDSKQIKRIARLIERRLGRKLQPFDIWYDGFRPRGRIGESELDKLTKKRYPTAAAFKADLPRILTKLGFTRARAAYLAERIAVDPSRGAGHAMEAGRRQDRPRLRTRVGAKGMDYKGYNIAIHELGHNVEQVFSLYQVDHTLLAGVPNTAFTEALAFVFQARDLELLGLSKPDMEGQRLETINTLWMTYEIGGVGLLDLAVWRWLYRHPDATPERLRRATLAISKKIWNRYYAPVFGHRDVTLLAVYSHLISNMLYVPDYSLGYLIAFQIEKHLRGGAALGPEFERMARFGRVTPDLWMRNATGQPVGPQALLQEARRALDRLER